MNKKEVTIEEVLNHIETGITATGQKDSYCVGFCNALVWLKSCITHEEPQYFEDKRGSENETCKDCRYWYSDNGLIGSCYKRLNITRHDYDDHCADFKKRGSEDGSN